MINIKERIKHQEDEMKKRANRQIYSVDQLLGFKKTKTIIKNNKVKVLYGYEYNTM